MDPKFTALVQHLAPKCATLAAMTPLKYGELRADMPTNAIVKATARAFRWREMLENGVHASIAEIASAEKIKASYLGRVLRLTLLAPDIVEAFLGGRQPPGLQLDRLLRRFPVGWKEQRANFLN